MNDSSRIVTGNRNVVSFINFKFSTVNNFITGIYRYLKTSLDISNLNVQPTLGVIATRIGFYLTTYLLFYYVMYAIRVSFRDYLIESTYFFSSAERILLVIAHPDDESMFFGPFILRMVKKNKCVYVLCLSNGSPDVSKQLRKRELLSSCQMLGMKSENVFLCYSSARVTGQRWRSNVALLINDYVITLDIDTVVTFDKNGVNGHKDHIEAFKALSFLNLRKELPLNCNIFLLESVGFVRAYTSMIDLVFSLFLSQDKIVFILSRSEHLQVLDALRMHMSHLNWQRRLFIMFSRFTYVNTLFEMPRYGLT